MGATEKLDKLKAQIDREFAPLGKKYSCKSITDLAFVYSNADYLKKHGSINTASEDAANVFKKLGFTVEQRSYSICQKAWEIGVPEEEAKESEERG